MNAKEKYNQVSKHVFMLALLPPSPYKFDYAARLLAKGVMKASASPLDEGLTRWPWFKAGIAILKKPLYDDNEADSPEDLNVPDAARDLMVAGFGTFVNSLRWYVQRLDSRAFLPVLPVEILFESASAILGNIVRPVDGGDFEEGPDGDIVHFQGKPIADLLFYENTSVGIREFNPRALDRLYDACVSMDLKDLPWGTLLNHRESFNRWYEEFLASPDLGTDDLDAYLEMLEPHLPDVSEDRWFEGYVKGTSRKVNETPPPAPPQPVAPKVEKKSGMRFTVREDASRGVTTYHDNIFDTEYTVSNRTGLKKTIARDLVGDLDNGVRQWHDDWSKVKGQFQRDAGSRFNTDQIIHETKPNLVGEKTAQFTGRWRIRTDEEIAEWAKTHEPARSKRPSA